MSEREARDVTVSGIVQGVGFRAFVAYLAGRHGLAGWARNEGAGVRIHIEGPASSVEDFLIELSEEAPEAAVVSGVEIAGVAPANYAGFTIRE